MENVLIQAHYIIYTAIGVVSLLGLILKGYISSLKKDIKEAYQVEITKARTSIEGKFDKEVDHLSRKIDKECSGEAIKSKVKDFFDGELKLIQSDVKQIKDSVTDIKTIMNSQQETLIAIQMSITELKPRLENLENRVTRLENKKDD